MSIKVNGTEIPVSGTIKANNTNITKVVANGITVWSKSTPKSYSLHISGEPFYTSDSVTISGIDTSVYTKATLKIWGDNFGWDTNGSHVIWLNTYYTEEGTFNVPVGNGTLTLVLGHDNATVDCTLTFS